MKITKSNGDLSFKKAKHRQYSISSLVLISTFSLALFGCGGAQYEHLADESSKVMADSISRIASSNAAVVGKADSTHTFIRTADIKFKVKDVKQSTFDIEDLVSRHGGYITYTNLSSTISYTNKI